MPLLVLLVLTGSGLVGCTPLASSDAPFLLGQDHFRMTDVELVTYEQELSDELVRSSRSGNSDVTVGVGFGSWGSNVGYGVRADKWLGSTDGNETTMELKARHDEVRAEMKQRGLLP